jgi:hypothetical protein
MNNFNFFERLNINPYKPSSTLINNKLINP